jgi:hypothetical protein
MGYQPIELLIRIGYMTDVGPQVPVWGLYLSRGTSSAFVRQDLTTPSKQLYLTPRMGASSTAIWQSISLSR